VSFVRTTWAPVPAGALRAARVGSAPAIDAAGTARPRRPGASSAVVKIEGDLDPKLADRVTREIAAAEEARVLRVLVNSSGGYVTSAERIIRSIRSRKRGLVVAYASALCQSAALDVLLAADIRYATHNTSFLLHSTRHSASDLPGFLTARGHRQMAAELDAKDREGMEALKSRFNLSALELRIIAESDLILAPERALELGVVHGVLDRLPRILFQEPERPVDAAKRRQLDARNRILARMPLNSILGM